MKNFLSRVKQPLNKKGKSEKHFYFLITVFELLLLFEKVTDRQQKRTNAERFGIIIIIIAPEPMQAILKVIILPLCLL